MLPENALPFVSAMRTWRRVVGGSMGITFAGLMFFLPVAWAGMLILIVAIPACLYCMTRAASVEVGTGYALRQLLLAVLLLPPFFIGVFVVTRLVEAEMNNWRLAARPPTA